MDTVGGKTLEGYEKIRSVGKGAYGTAFLYRKSFDDSLVVIKEINMIESSATERQMALNEVQVLSILNHPNIIRYYKSFEKDGILMIEMEYAGGGTLAQFLKNQSQLIHEENILLLFRQIVSAIRYMHDHNILHRDLKTANVFLTTDHIVKVGDFGISKVMATKDHANTVLGTPYYISPEMCEGKQYDQKSDIWALGCILYEMACLEKTFEGSNLLVLVNKITKGEFRAPTGYSPAFQNLLRDLLKKDPTLRPSAAKLEDDILPLMPDFEYSVDVEEPTVSNNGNLGKNKNLRSVLYELRSFKHSTELIPIPLPPRARVLEVSTSNTHCIALTSDLEVFTWGIGTKGQLGHGEEILSIQNPQAVEALRGKNIKLIGAGDAFSVFVSETGMLMTCGDGSFGCLGHGDCINLTKPRLVEKLISVDITAIACGSHHTVALSNLGVVYSWGRGQDGCLGNGNEDNRSLPSVVEIPKQIVPQAVRCGINSTMIITLEGSLLGFGNNLYNKLGVNNPLISFFFNRNHDSNKILTPTRANIGYKIVDVALSPTHTVALTEEGYALTMGRNTEGQLGRKKQHFGQLFVSKLADAEVKIIAADSTFSIAGTKNNTVYFWGTRYNDKLIKNTAKMSYSSSKTESEHWFTRSMNNVDKEMIIEPKEVLALYASPQQIEKGETLKLSGLYTFQNNPLVLVETSVPLVTKNVTINDSSAQNDAEEMDKLGPIPDWIKSELAESVAPWTGN